MIVCLLLETNALALTIQFFHSRYISSSSIRKYVTNVKSCQLSIF